MKAQKNETEGFRKVMVRDGVAMVKFFYWLTHNAGKEAMNEYSIGEKLRGFRAEGENFVGESFGSIVGYKDNGAIMHYSAKSEGSKEVTNDASILVDSGGQYLEGTTDITRTLALGTVSEEFKRNSTLVLQGLIRLIHGEIPERTRGVQLMLLQDFRFGWKERLQPRNRTWSRKLYERSRRSAKHQKRYESAGILGRNGLLKRTGILS
jgi:Xaa-Pro aminopeptidase